MSDEAKFQCVDFITIIRNDLSSQLACALWTDGDHRCQFHGHKFVGSKKDILSKVQAIIAEEALAAPIPKNMTDRDLLDEINKMLFWDYDEERWIPKDEDPGWNGFDLVCAIAELLEENGHGPKE